MPPDSHALMIFVHIPKTAGTTFREILDRQFMPSQIRRIGPDFQAGINQIKALPGAEKDRIGCISGHLPYGLHACFDNRSVRYISFVRDPVDRVLSEYLYFKKKPELLPLIGLDRTRKLTPHDYLHYLRQVGMDNFQTRILSGYNNLLEHVLPPYGPLPAEIGEAFIDRLLDDYAFIGTVELFDESLLLMQQLFNWRSIRYVSRNVAETGSEKLELKRSLGAEILRLNKLDSLLYQKVTARITDRIKAEEKAFDRQLHHHRLRNSCYGWCWNLYAITGVRKLRLAAINSLTHR
jgi:hypothetical protein